MNNYSLADAIYYMLLAVSLLLILQILYNNLVTYKKKLKDNLSVMLISRAYPPNMPCMKSIR